MESKRSTLPAWILWGIALVGGFAALVRYEATPGTAAAPPSRWPSTTSVPRASGGRATLLLFVHPRCPCTKATLKELAVALARRGDRVETRVVFVRPPGVAAHWERSALWEQAAALPGAQRLPDEAGREARRFSVATSGQVLLYGSDGRLRYSGGITAARGHEGDNAGRFALEAALDGAQGPTAFTPVFGCPLLPTPHPPEVTERPR